MCSYYFTYYVYLNIWYSQIKIISSIYIWKITGLAAFSVLFNTMITHGHSYQSSRSWKEILLFLSFHFRVTKASRRSILLPGWGNYGLSLTSRDGSPYLDFFFSFPFSCSLSPPLLLFNRFLLLLRSLFLFLLLINWDGKEQIQNYSSSFSLNSEEN